MKAKRRQKRKPVPQARDEKVTAEKLQMLKEVDDRRYQIAVLFIRGNRPANIGRIVGVPTQVVTKELDIVRRDWIGVATQEILRLREDEYNRLLDCQVEAEAAYQRSLEPRTVTKATKHGPGGQPVTSAVTYKRDGDPRWRAEVRKCIEARCKLLGLNLQPEEPLPAIQHHNTINFTNVNLSELKRIRGELLALANGNVDGTGTGNLPAKPV